MSPSSGAGPSAQGASRRSQASVVGAVCLGAPVVVGAKWSADIAGRLRERVGRARHLLRRAVHRHVGTLDVFPETLVTRRQALYQNRAHLGRVGGGRAPTEASGRDADLATERGGEVAVCESKPSLCATVERLRSVSSSRSMERPSRTRRWYWCTGMPVSARNRRGGGTAWRTRAGRARGGSSSVLARPVRHRLRPSPATAAARACEAVRGGTHYPASRPRQLTRAARR